MGVLYIVSKFGGWLWPSYVWKPSWGKGGSKGRPGTMRSHRHRGVQCVVPRFGGLFWFPYVWKLSWVKSGGKGRLRFGSTRYQVLSRARILSYSFLSGFWRDLSGVGLILT